MSSSHVIEASGLERRYGEIQALKGTDLHLEKGEFLGLLGPNGAGKTTTLRLIACLEQRDGGQLSVMGHDPNKGSTQILGRLGVVPQELAIYDNLTALENLNFFAGMHGLTGTHKVDRVQWALQVSGLEDRAGDLVQGFSGGMKRRLNLVVGLLHEPDLVLLDEPTVGVDPQSRNHLFDMIEGLRGQVSLIYTTHMMGEIERLCDRIVIMDEGKAVVQGTLDELQHLPGVKDQRVSQLELEDPQRAAEAEETWHPMSAARPRCGLGVHFLGNHGEGSP
ncbi:MAG: ABC transporter ATP-binding protein [Planctomycetota bacterium]|nr:ABC transporter ATP-binding protein [Planctomycetota bacterium]